MKVPALSQPLLGIPGFSSLLMSRFNLSGNHYFLPQFLFVLVKNCVAWNQILIVSFIFIILHERNMICRTAVRGPFSEQQIRHAPGDKCRSKPLVRWCPEFHKPWLWRLMQSCHLWFHWMIRFDDQICHRQCCFDTSLCAEMRARVDVLGNLGEVNRAPRFCFSSG